MQDLGVLPGRVSSEAWGVSADGRTVVGQSADANRIPRAFLWTAETGMQDLGALPGGNRSVAHAVSADGRVVVGRSENANRIPRAFLWTAETGMQDLGARDRTAESIAWGVSADGQIVVGETSGRAFRWTTLRGFEDLTLAYLNLLSPSSILEAATAVTPDGRYIVGYGYNSATRRREAFLLDTGFPRRGDVDRSGCVDAADLLRVLTEFGGRGYRNEDLNWDGVVDDADLLEVLFNFGSGC